MCSCLPVLHKPRTINMCICLSPSVVGLGHFNNKLYLLMASFFLFFFFFSQTLRARNKANKQTEGERAQQTTEAKDEDERDPYSLCSSVDLDKVCACFETGLICDQMKSASFLHLFLSQCVLLLKLCSNRSDTGNKRWRMT